MQFWAPEATVAGDMNPAAALANSKSIRMLGNALFSEGKYAEAIAQYCSALQQLQQAGQGNALYAEACAMLLGNVAECYLKLGAWRDALILSSSSLQLDPMREKNVIRRARAIVMWACEAKLAWAPHVQVIALKVLVSMKTFYE